MARKGDLGDLRPLKITPCGYQSPLERFSDTQPPPRLAPCRNNLVACSQYYNLCFVASQDRILVHSPIFLDQTLLSQRSIINLASSNARLTGYIDPTYPHSINQLVVADLGLEELVIAVTDDGDVVAYTTRSIRDDLNSHGLAYNTPCFQSAIKPYFIRNVHNSAWGVAVHREARMIAVSSNSAKIHVFAFALGHLSSDSSDESMTHHGAGLHLLSSLDGPEWVRVEKKDSLMPSDRSRNLELILEKHWTNVPNLAFYNPCSSYTDDIFLVSTDIHGVTYIWNVWKRLAVLKLETPSQSRGRPMGWGLLCIDPFFAQEVKSRRELYRTVRSEVPDYEPVHFTARSRKKNQAADLDVNIRTDDGDLNDDLDDLDDDLDDDSDDLEEEDEVESDSEDDDISLEDESPSEEPDADAQIAMLQDSMATFSILHTTRHDVRLVNTRISPQVEDMDEVVSFSILNQRLYPYDIFLRRLQRLNMVHQVPELSLVIVGDQMGRVAVLSITRRKAERRWKSDDIGFRVEAFLPSKSQEDDGQRPKTDLLGVAVAPVQGHERRREDLLDAAIGEHLKRRRVVWSRAYRVILYYLDHTVLSYELTR
ncbi:MAG: hypothetical protein Q9221_008894 [Calogaya cf. arnoldii]